MSAPVTPKALASRAAALYRRECRAWAATPSPAPAMDVPLHPPTERAALDDLNATRAWVESWRAAEVDGPLAVDWVTKSWARVGAQQVPARARVEGIEDVVELAALADAGIASEWQAMRSRCVDLAGALVPRAQAPEVLRSTVARHAGAIAALPPGDFAVLEGVVAWLAEHPVSGRRIRSLPIRGIDTKWLERHRSLVTALVSAVTGIADLGLLSAPTRVRLRSLDPNLAVGGLRDVAAPVDELAALSLAPATVLVTENLETLLELPDQAGAVAIHGAGFAVEALALVPWVAQARILYWGDLDSHGFAILHRARAVGLEFESVLMDRATLEEHRDLWVAEPSPASGEYPLLTPAEQDALSALRAHGNVRLEQERIPWGYATSVLHDRW